MNYRRHAHVQMICNNRKRCDLRSQVSSEHPGNGGLPELNATLSLFYSMRPPSQRTLTILANISGELALLSTISLLDKLASQHEIS